MAADFDKPTINGESYVDILSGIRAKFEVVSTMSYGDAVQGSIPTNAVQFLDGRLQKWDGSSFQNAPISITGGGTGASTAAGARSTLGVPQAGTLSGQVRTNGESDLLYVPTSRQVATSGALTGGGTLDGDVTVSIADASTSAKGAVQLYNGLNSTSTSLALTAAAGKVLSGAISAKGSNLEALWSGSSTSIDLDGLPGGYPGDGAYIILINGYLYSIHLWDNNYCENVVRTTINTNADVITVDKIYKTSGNAIEAKTHTAILPSAAASSISLTISGIYKVV